MEKGGRGKMTFGIAPLPAKKKTTIRTICQLQSPTEEEMPTGFCCGRVDCSLLMCQGEKQLGKVA